MVFSPIRVRGDRFSCPNPLWTDSFTTCSSHCKFCFVKETEENFKQFPIAESTSFETVENFFKKAFSTVESKNGVVLAIRNKLPLGIGSRCEPFQNEEIESEQTLKFLELAKDYKYPVIINTKSSRVCSKKYFKLLGELENPTVIINLLATKEVISSRLEPDITPQMYRWNAVKFLNLSGIRCDIRVAPLLPNINDSEDQIKKTLEKAKRFGANHIAMEYYHLRYPKIANKKFAEAGFEFKPIYDEVTKKGYFRKKAEIFRDEATKLKLKISFPDWVEVPFLSDSEACCGTTDRYNFYKCTFQHALTLLKEKRRLSWEDFTKTIDFFIENDFQEMKSMWKEKNKYKWSLWDLIGEYLTITSYDSEGLPIFSKLSEKNSLEVW